MSKTRHTLVRTFPVTFLHDVTRSSTERDWHHLIYATRGTLEVIAGDTRRIVPADRAVWIPAGIRHTDVMRAPIAMRSIYVSARIRNLPREVVTLAVTPLLRELVLHITRLGALERSEPTHAHLAAVLFDLLAAAEPIALELPMPRDERARRFAELVIAKPGDARTIRTLARRAGASQRTLERLFRDETGSGVGAWRRRVRLFHALRLLEQGTPVGVVAEVIGYATASAFSQAYARQFGHPPTRRATSH